MKNKVLVELIVPEIDKVYNVYIPINKRVGNIIMLVNKAIFELTNETYVGTTKSRLYNRITNQKYELDKLVRETDIRNGTILVLI